MHRAGSALSILLALVAGCQAVPQDAPAARASAASAAALPAWLDLPNFVLLDERVASGGPPSLATVAELPARGYGMVIDLRTAQEPGVAEERAVAEAAGLRYVHIPVRGVGFDLADAQRLLDALDSAPAGAVLLHCRSGGRAGALWGLAQGLDRGMLPAQAAALARQSGVTVSDEAAARVAAELDAAVAKQTRD